jgi:hypothetical protein
MDEYECCEVLVRGLLCLVSITSEILPLVACILMFGEELAEGAFLAIDILTCIVVAILILNVCFHFVVATSLCLELDRKAIKHRRFLRLTSQIYYSSGGMCLAFANPVVTYDFPFENDWGHIAWTVFTCVITILLFVLRKIFLGFLFGVDIASMVVISLHFVHVLIQIGEANARRLSAQQNQRNARKPSIEETQALRVVPETVHLSNEVSKTGPAPPDYITSIAK